ncbi:MAG TPA: Spy/CpxP family protein refolding chaperone [Terriglobales bacterium]|jgi:protein CpxP|nr:Spy/CpxP family protein refolding chaperone [Terriglobales bacterium]
MKARSIKIPLIALAVIVVVSVAVSQNVRSARWQGGGDGMFGGHSLAFFAHRLDLTDEQQAQAKDIMAKEKPTLKPLFQQLAQTRHQLRQFGESGNFDEAQVRAIATQQSQTLTELTVQKARIEAELVKMLTPDQKTKLTQMMDHREQRMQRFMSKQQSPAENQ